MKYRKKDSKKHIKNRIEKKSNSNKERMDESNSL